MFLFVCFSLLVFFRFPVWLKIRCTYLMGELSLDPRNQGMIKDLEYVGGWGGYLRLFN